MSSAAEPLRAAGLQLVDPNGRVLFMRRSGSGDHGGEWALPGGGIEGTEDARMAALREFGEECGGFARDALINQGDETANLQEVHNHVMDGVDFTTFRARVRDPFQPNLEGEHDGYVWSDPARPPEPLHPGVRQMLADTAGDAEERFDWRDGDLEIIQPENPQPAPSYVEDLTAEEEKIKPAVELDITE